MPGIGQIHVKERISTSWKEKALCRDEGWPTGGFYPTRHDGPTMVREAKSVCERCPVRLECLAYSLVCWEPVGIWGGRTQIERRRLRQAAIVIGLMRWVKDRGGSRGDVVMYDIVMGWLREIGQEGERVLSLKTTMLPPSDVDGAQSLELAAVVAEHPPA